MPRFSTGIPGLDGLLGGGLLPGRLTVIVGATGIGKTQLGVQFAHAGKNQEGHPGIIFDLTARGDSQSQAEYAQRMFDWRLQSAIASAAPPLEHFFDPQHSPGNYLHIFERRGKRVTRADLDADAWHNWQAELNAKLSAAIAFFYGNFVSGVRRAVIDGVEPSARASESVQLDLFDYVYHQILRKDADWVARDLFRERYRQFAEVVAKSNYDYEQIACVLLYTSAETMLEELIRRPLDEGDVLANANTVIQMGKINHGGKLGRALHIAKHRGSAASDAIVPFEITNHGLRLA